MNKKKKGSDRSRRTLNIAVCVLFFERIEQTIECIKSFLLSNAKIYILNNGSSPLKRSILGEFCENYKNIKIFDSSVNLGVGVGRNYLLKNTKEEWLFFVDSDIVMKTRDWLQKVEKHISEYPDIEVFIPELFNVHENRYISYRSLRLAGNEAIFDVEIDNDLSNYFPGGSSIVNRKIFGRLGLYDAKIFVGFEDYELCIRGVLSESPVKARLIHDVKLLHIHRYLRDTEDKKATLTRYNANFIEISSQRIKEKHNIILVSGWKQWVPQQLANILEVDTSLKEMRDIHEEQLKICTGLVFDESEDISQHIFSVKKYSAHIVKEVPSKFIRTFTNKSNWTKHMYKKLISKIGLKNYDVLHSHVNPWFISLCDSSKKNINKWIHTYHTLYFEEDYTGGLKPWQQEVNRNLIEIASKADLKISISKWLHDYLLERYSIETEIIPNGVDLKRCDNANPEKFTEKFGLRDFILFVGNINESKGLGIFAKLASQIPDIPFLMLGKSINKANLIKTYDLQIPKNLSCISKISLDDTLNAISACKVFVVTSKREGLPITLLEAMGMGKAVVAPANKGCKETIQSNVHGYLYESESFDDLVGKTRKALISEEIGEKARERVKINYDCKILIKRLDLLYEK